MEIHPGSGAPVPALSGSELVGRVPAIQTLASVDVLNLFNIPSDHMGPQNWIALKRAVSEALARDDIAAVVVSHGTDTLEETAWFLDLTLSNAKPVVLVGAQRNASAPDFDGPENLVAGIRTALCPDAQGKGVLVVLNSQINAARYVSKTHTWDIDSFKSGCEGPLGQVDGDQVVFLRNSKRRQFVPLIKDKLPRVDIVSMYCGADGALVSAAVAAGAGGIVIQALGLGNVSIGMYDAIVSAISAGVHVVISTRVPVGGVQPFYGFVGGGQSLSEAGAVFAGDLSPQKARILLMLALQIPRAPAEIQELFDK